MPTQHPAERGQQLLPHEVDMCRLVGRGLSNYQVGRALHLSENTIKTRMKRVMVKTGCTSRTGLIVHLLHTEVLDLQDLIDSRGET